MKPADRITTLICSAALTLCTATTLFGIPKIDIDSATAHKGIIPEGSTQSVRHEFVIRNIGTDTLLIQRVKASCGCTVVKYDSIIPPGKSGKISPEVNLKGMHGGQISKTVTVTSNAENNPVLTLTIKMHLMPIVGTSSNWINLFSINGDTARAEISLSTQKKDLLVKKVRFKAEEIPNQPFWQSGKTLDLKYTVSRADSVDAESLWNYALKLDAMVTDTLPVRGDFIFETNHPKKTEVVVRGQIQAIRQPASMERPH